MSEDKIDQFLYACFDGQLDSYFNKEKENVIKWIISEYLECMFRPSLFDYSISDIIHGNAELSGNEEDINNTQSWICNPTIISSYKYKNLTDDERSLYFDRLNKVIAYRNTIQIEPHLPFEWIVKVLK